MKHFFSIICCILLTQSNWAQDSQIIGKIVSKSRDLEGISVLNQTTDTYVETETGGYFSIPAKVGDTLIFSSVHLIGIKHIVAEKDLLKKLVFIPMEENSTILDALFIDRAVNSRTLGFGDAITLSPLERRLHTSRSSGGGIIPIGAIINSLTGRTKMLNRAVLIETEYNKVQEFIDHFKDDYFVNFLKIPKNQIQAFAFFVYKDPDIKYNLEQNNKHFLDLLLSEKATEFKAKHLKFENK